MNGIGHFEKMTWRCHVADESSDFDFPCGGSRLGGENAQAGIHKAAKIPRQ